MQLYKPVLQCLEDMYISQITLKLLHNQQRLNHGFNFYSQMLRNLIIISVLLRWDTVYQH